jgi:hypothetical protein
MLAKNLVISTFLELFHNLFYDEMIHLLGGEIMIKVLEYKYRNGNDNVGNTETRISEFKDFDEYLNLQAVGKTGFPKYFKLIARSYNLEKQEVLTHLHDDIEGKSYRMFSKVIS